MKDWTEPYIGLPWTLGGRSEDGLDCWGLVRLVLERERGVTLPAWDEGDALDPTPRGRAREFERHWKHFTPVTPGQEREGDICTLAVGGQLWHVGVWLEAPCLALHIEGPEGALVEDWTRRPDFFRQYAGCYRAH